MGTGVGTGKEGLKAEPATRSQHRNPRPDPLMLSRRTGAKGLGRRGERTAQAEEEGPETRRSTRAYLRTKNTETMQRKQEKVREGKERKKEKNNEGTAHATATQVPPQRGPQRGEEAKQARPAPLCEHGCRAPSARLGAPQPRRSSLWQRRSQLRKGVGPRKAGKNTSSQGRGASNIPGCARTLLFARCFLWNRDCQCGSETALCLGPI